MTTQAPYPYRGQADPNDWDLVLKNYIDQNVRSAQPTFGDHFKPVLPTKMSSSKCAIDLTAYASNWDGVGPAVSGAAIEPYVKFNGLPTINAYGVSVDPSGQGSTKLLDFETIFTGKQCSLMEYWLGSADPTFLRVFIDDEEVDSGPFGVNGVAQWWLNFNFAVYGTYKIRVVGNYYLANIACNVGGIFKKPAPRKALGIISDSYFESLFNGVVCDSPPARLATVLGWDIWNGAEGGTGFINPGAGGGFSEFGSAARLAALDAMEIDALLVHGTINDQSYPVADVKAAMIQYYQDVAEVKPGLPVVQVGIQPVYYSTGGIPAPPALASLVTAQKEAVAVSPNVVGYIDPYSLRWLTGTGDEGHTQGDGNQDYAIGATDHVHLSSRGSMMWAVNIRDEMAPMKASL